MTGAIILAAVVGFWWGEWAANRRSSNAKNDSGTILLTTMLAQIVDKRRFVGPGMTITRSETIEVQGAKYRIQLVSEGDPEAVERDEAA